MSKRERFTPSKTAPRVFGPDSNEPHWLIKCETTFLSTGKLNLSSVPLPDISAIKTRTSLRELNISRTKLESLQGLAYQPNLQIFRATKSKLNSFKNFYSISHASMVFLQNTPLAKIPNYIIGVILLAEDDRVIIDGKLVSPKWYKKAATYPPFVRDLLNSGWMIEYPCPSANQLRDLCREFNVTYIEDGDQFEQNYENHESPNNVNPINRSPKETSDDLEPYNGGEIEEEEEEDHWTYLNDIDEMMNYHNQVISDAYFRFELQEPDYEQYLNPYENQRPVKRQHRQQNKSRNNKGDVPDDVFASEVKNLLSTKKNFVFGDGFDMDLQIVSAVRALCAKKLPDDEQKQ
ncbi:hypothetical protein TRFO_23997 [Tritrichomonas foetus]|uniref:Uncharacterized protein n=1 Tax=Tritrichomonas foetus TaxID=1144522 RepID=A0A1J4K9U3_9EUKA|nr:hypothetical protein TRFO_23997 [Tritrichomonas foetus]|eukprot:OHT07722.1 hypothetical protein TRFO_23997 [Tritrichomonas foetus]